MDDTGESKTIDEMTAEDWAEARAARDAFDAERGAR